MNQGMGVTVDGGQPNWEKGVVEMSAMCRHMPPTRWCVVVAIEERSCVWRRVNDYLSSGFMSVGRSGPDAPNGGIVGRSWSNF